jgi:UDP-glucose 4-epimerase
MTRILVTGARGFLGRHLAHTLHEAGHEVWGLGHGNWPEGERVAWGVRQWLNGDVERSNIESLIGPAGSVDLIFHLAGGSAVAPSLTAPAEDFRRSVVATLEVLEWARAQQRPPRLVLASSAAVYGDTFDRPIAPSDACCPTSPYGNHKWMAEQLLRSYAHSFGVPGAVVRLFSVYGPELRKQLLWDIATRVSSQPERLKLGGTGTELRDWVHVVDAVRALRLGSEASCTACPILHGATGLGVSVIDVATRLCERLGHGGIPIEFSGVARPGDPRTLIASASELATSPTIAWTDGIESYANWFRSTVPGRSP